LSCAEGWCSVSDAFHHCDELLEGDLSVSILVDLFNDSVDGSCAQGVRTSELQNFFNLFSRNNARAVLVEHLEGSLELVVRGQLTLVHGGNHELRVVNETASISVHGVEHDFDLFVRHHLSVVFKVTFLHFLDGELSVSVLVKGAENLGQVVSLSLREELGGNEGVGSLLEGLVDAETLHVVKYAEGEGLVDGEVGELGQPCVVKSLRSGWSLVLVIGKQLSDEVLGLIRDDVPDSVVKVERSLSHLAHDLLVALTVEGRHAGQKDVSNDTCRPDVALVVIVLVQDFWGNVVWGTEFLVEGSAWVVHEGGTEVDNLDLIEFFVLFKQNVLWLEISVDNVVLMAVVDALEYLLHEDGSITLREFASLENLIEKFTSLADLGNEVVSLLILEELVHLDDVGVIDLLENVDLVEEHALLILVHIALSQDLDGPLGVRLSVHTKTHLTESASSEDLANSVKVSEFSLSLSDEISLAHAHRLAL